jgi:hypothetical protein
VAFWPLPATSADDRAAWRTDEQTRMVIAIEHRWVERLLSTPIYRYHLPGHTFVDCEDHGVHLSRDVVVPTRVERIPSSMRALEDARVELRLLPSLVALSEALMKTSLHWSLIRMRYAEGWTLSSGSPTVPRG